MTSLRTFYNDSVDYVSPQNNKEWRAFYLQFPRAMVRFYWFELSYRIRRGFYVWMAKRTTRN